MIELELIEEGELLGVRKIFANDVIAITTAIDELKNDRTVIAVLNGEYAGMFSEFKQLIKFLEKYDFESEFIEDIKDYYVN